jgi:hypothetical protein
MKKNIIQICPTYPPNISGVGDYTKLLANFLKKKNINSKILVSDYLNNKNVKQILFGKKNKNLISLLEKINSNVVILHAAFYGYASRGLCFDLIKSLEKWKQNDKNRKLITIFHEIYATGPIYRMSFWTSLPQKYLAKKLLKLSNVALATSKQNNITLSSFDKKKIIIYSNVFSNIGELKKNKKFHARKNIAIIFGNTYQKQILYKDILVNKNQYEVILKKMSIKKIIDVGPKIEISKQIKFIDIFRVGVKSKKYISLLLRNSKAGLVFYPVNQMTKSGIIAAYASHGLVIINLCKEKIFKTNEFIPGVHYISKIKENNFSNLQKIANETFRNYKKNALNKIGSLLINIIKNNKTK